MSSPSLVSFTRHANRFLSRVQNKRPDLLRPATPSTHLPKLSPFSKKNAPKKQLFPGNNHFNCQISFSKCIKFSSSPKKAKTELESPLEADLNGYTEDGKSPVIGYEIASPFLGMLCQKSQTNDVLLLGRGTFGSVYFALEKGERRALKVADKCDLIGEKNALDLCHPNVASVLRFWSPYLNGTGAIAVMEYAGSLTLHRLLLKQDLTLSVQAKNSICIQVARALKYCHDRMLVHLDVKPGNILVSTSTGVCKLADFGCSLYLTHLNSKHGDSVRIQCSKRCALVGTVAYVAPELFHGQDPTTAADLYSLGMVLYQLETKRIPFEGLHPHTLIYRVVSMNERPSIPWTSECKDYWAIVNACWNPEPKGRPKARDIIYKIRR